MIERRREDVRDQMKELSNSKPQLLMNQEETIQEEARQRRAAEREVCKLVQLQYLIFNCRLLKYKAEIMYLINSKVYLHHCRGGEGEDFNNGRQILLT